MHICFTPIDFHSLKGGGGIASYVRVLADALAARGHRVSIVAVGSSHRGDTSPQGWTVVWETIPDLHWYLAKLTPLTQAIVLPLREWERSIAIYRGLKRIAGGRSIDIVEGCESGNSWVRWNDAWPLVIRLHGEPYVFAKYSHQPLHLGLRLNRRLELAALRQAARVTSPSHSQAREVAHALGWLVSRIRVIPNPVAPWILEKASNLEGAGADWSSPIVLYTGRIERRKGTIPLLRSVPHVAKACPDVRYTIAGGRHTSIDDRALNKVLDDDIRGRVTLLGHIPWEDLVDWYRRAALFVMPSFYETFGISCLEAMAFGLPVVVTRASALPEVVEDGVTGILVPPGDSQALAEAIICLLRNPDLRHRMGQAGRERVLAEFTVERVVGQTLELYEEIVQVYS